MCERCAGEGTENISLSAEVLGRELGIEGWLTKTCESCDGSGENEIVRDKRLDELTDRQIKLLLHADMYREGADEETQQEVERAQRMSRGP